MTNFIAVKILSIEARMIKCSIASQLFQPRVHHGALTVFKRSYYMWLNFVFNRIDSSRLEEFGPDRVAAEWVLRNGGGVKFTHQNSWIHNYNALEMGPAEKFKLQKIDGKATCITTGGLQHLVGLNHLDYLSLHGCKYVTDVGKILPVKETLLELDIGYCPAITDILPLGQLK
ncbi:hypothetical protein QZH41_009189 [Actinostola sp. cb2023]|nr:hypothetical protein QZH41_009189 [Actinostola sp. cb2023]